MMCLVYLQSRHIRDENRKKMTEQIQTMISGKKCECIR